MDAKLTLKLDEYSIEKAKCYAAERGLSLSGMVENFFNGITTSTHEPAHSEYSPVVQELSGIISLAEDFDYKAIYTEHLETKYE